MTAKLNPIRAAWGRVVHVSIVALFALVLESAQGAPVDLTQWFLRATAYHVSSTSREMSRPDFLGGKSRDAMPCKGWNGTGPHPAMFNGVWELNKYDRKHRIALASGTTDQCSVALFEAPAPGVAAPDADLSRFSTGRGLRIGSTYEEVLSTYGGPPVKRGRHFVVAYSSFVPGVTVGLPHKAVKLPEDVTIVVDNDRVSSITVYVDEGGLF